MHQSHSYRCQKRHSVRRMVLQRIGSALWAPTSDVVSRWSTHSAVYHLLPGIVFAKSGVKKDKPQHVGRLLWRIGRVSWEHFGRSSWMTTSLHPATSSDRKRLRKVVIRVEWLAMARRQFDSLESGVSPSHDRGARPAGLDTSLRLQLQNHLPHDDLRGKAHANCYGGVSLRSTRKITRSRLLADSILCTTTWDDSFSINPPH